MAAAHDAGAAVSIVGRCIGFNRIGKRCVFVDVVQLPDAAGAADCGDDDCEPVPPATSAKAVHLVGGHVPRERALEVPEVQPDDVVFSFFVGVNDTSLTQAAADALAVALGGAAGELPKPRVGDVFALTGVVRQRRTAYKGSGHAITCADATAVRVIARGEAPRPGDYSSKWRLQQAAAAGSQDTSDDAPQQPGRKQPSADAAAAPQGESRRNKDRFHVLADYCAAVFLRGADPAAAVAALNALPPRGERAKQAAMARKAGGASSAGAAEPAPCAVEAAPVPAGPSVLDIAGGGGRLSHELRQQGFSPTIVDPRGLDAKAKDMPNGTTRGGSKWARALDGIPTVKAFFNLDTQRDVVESARVLIGLHCDGAVNEIIRAACQLQRSFVICACCVFPKTYHRVLNDGTPVVDRPQLNAWIVEEARRQGFAGALATVSLPFAGANACVVGVAPDAA